MPGARTLRCAAHRSVRSTGGLAPPARACSGVTRRPMYDVTGWPDLAKASAATPLAPARAPRPRTRSAAGKNSLLGQATWQAWPQATDERWPGCSRAGGQGAATRQAASAQNRPLGNHRSQGGRAGLFTRRGEEAARVFQQGQWALAGRALRNPSAACPCGSH